MPQPHEEPTADDTGDERQEDGRYWHERAQDDRTGRSAAAERVRDQARWVDLQVQRAMERGEFDDLPGAGKPLQLPETHDPDWWVKKLIEREEITGIAPAAITLRREDAELDVVLDREATEEGVRRVVEDFNRRVVEARRQLTGGPPVVTPTRDADAEVVAWQQRRAERRRRTQDAAQDAARAAGTPRPAGATGATRKRRWWRRRTR